MSADLKKKAEDGAWATLRGAAEDIMKKKMTEDSPESWSTRPKEVKPLKPKEMF